MPVLFSFGSYKFVEVNLDLRVCSCSGMEATGSCMRKQTEAGL